MGIGRLKNYIFKLTPNKILKFYQEPIKKKLKQEQEFGNLSYSQEGEDLLLNRFLENKENGFYVDIGAHHPKRFSNTYNFYKKGWRGINIDAMPGSMDAFNIERPKDINLELGVSKEKGELVYYMFNEPALNTFSIIEAKKKDGLRDYKIIEKKNVLTYPLKEILNKHLTVNNKIDFMTIDVEGFDLEVVESNDWEKYRPYLVLVEDLEKYRLSELSLKSDLYKVLIAKEYQLVAKTFNTLFFKDNRI
jgi:FkbM family methyltransferase